MNWLLSSKNKNQVINALKRPAAPRAIFRSRSSVAARDRADPVRAAAAAADRRRMDRHCARGGSLVWAAVLHQHAARRQPVPGLLWLERLLGTLRAADGRLDGPDAVTH